MLAGAAVVVSEEFEVIPGDYRGKFLKSDARAGSTVVLERARSIYDPVTCGKPRGGVLSSEKK